MQERFLQKYIHLSIIIKVQSGKPEEGSRVSGLRSEVKCPAVSRQRRKPATRQPSVGASRVGSGKGSSRPGARDLNTRRWPRRCRGLTLSVMLSFC